VLFSSRHPEELQGLVRGLGPKAHAGTPAEAAAFGDVLFLAVPYKAYPELAAEIGPGLQGKVVLDAGNAFKARDGEIYDEVEAKGIGPTSAKYLPGARVVRGFNAAPVRVFLENANRPAPRLAIPIAGDDPAAIEVVKQLVSDAGFDPVVVGKLKDADKFAFIGPSSQLNLTAPELKEKLGVAP
jgi:predicted dinucleotide-binding enzyme